VETPGNSPIPAAHTHDGFFKAVFSQPEHAMAFFKSHLPPEVVVRIDWPSLVVLPGSFIKSSLQQVHADLLFSVRMGGAGLCCISSSSTRAAWTRQCRCACWAT
jgi:hypothetical protein